MRTTGQREAVICMYTCIHTYIYIFPGQREAVFPVLGSSSYIRGSRGTIGLTLALTLTLTLAASAEIHVAPSACSTWHSLEHS